MSVRRAPPLTFFALPPSDCQFHHPSGDLSRGIGPRELGNVFFPLPPQRPILSKEQLNPLGNRFRRGTNCPTMIFTDQLCIPLLLARHDLGNQHRRPSRDALLNSRSTRLSNQQMVSHHQLGHPRSPPVQLQWSPRRHRFNLPLKRLIWPASHGKVNPRHEEQPRDDL